jgi:polygalacturonase
MTGVNLKIKIVLFQVFTIIALFFSLCTGQVIDITTSPYNASTALADNAAAIQSAIAAAGSGDTVFVPDGTFLSGPIILKSNLNFQLASGAILRMLPFGSFPQNTNFLYGKNLTNISITGTGLMDGQGKLWWDDFNAGNPDNRPPAMIYLSGCTGVTLTGIAVQDSPKFHIQLLGACSKVYASGLSITAAWPSPNTDGIDLRGSNYIIENCYISDGDDVIQLGGSSDPVSDVIIRNCTFGTGHGLSIGGYTQGGVKNVLVDNCTFNGTQYGIRWKTGRDRGGIIDNLTYSNITMNGILLYPFFLTSFYPNPSSLPPTTDDWVTPTATTPYWSNITLKNIIASTAASGAKSPGIIWASAESPIINLMIDNVTVTGPSGVNFDIHHARGVTITCTCRVDGKQPPLNVGGFDAEIYYPACGVSTQTNTPVNSKTLTPYSTATLSFTRTVTLTLTATATFTRTSVYTYTYTPISTVTWSVTVTTTPVNTFTVTPVSTCWNLVWSDEFSGTSIDSANWNFETGCSGWGNSELENYTSNSTNAYVSGGNLVINAVNTGGGSCGYTSARMTTKNKVHFTYGKIEARIKTPYGQGMWPAFWMLGSDIDTAPWPACGEIDIMEMIGGGAGKDNFCYGTGHWDNNGHASYGGNTSVAWPAKLADNFHTYTIEWDASQLRWYFDGVLYNTLNTNGASMEEFTGKDFFIILNVAVGGTWPGNPDGTTIFPQQMLVDYVRWYQQGTCGATQTSTPVETISKTQTVSATKTWTASFTPTASITILATGTETLTAAPTQVSSIIVTLTQTSTVWVTPTHTVTATATTINPATAAPTAVHEPLLINDVYVYPNPLFSGRNLNFRIKLSGSASKSEIKIYTASFRLIYAQQLSTNILSPYCDLAIPFSKTEKLANATYYYIIRLMDKNDFAVKSKTGCFMVIR